MRTCLHFVLLLILLAATSFAAPDIPLTLTRTGYVSRAGSTVKLEMPVDSRSSVERGKALHTRTTPPAQHAPFASVDMDGNLVIATPSLAAPGLYAVSFEIDLGDQTRTATVAVSVASPPPVPAGSGTPVILLNGWQPPSLTQLSTCPTSPTDGSAPFGTLPKNLAVYSTFFDNCVECPSCPIEMLGADLGQRINSLQYSDGTPVEQVDVVVHSMGGLIVRSYLTGKSQTSGVFAPPAATKIRKAVFIGTPHFGSFLAPDFGAQTTDLRPGSQFLWDLSRWNQGSDDLREVDALAIAGNASLDSRSDGVVSLSSASLDFSGLPDQRTRIIDGCHIDGLSAYLLLCSTDQGIASSAESQQIVLSFLAGTTAWMSVGHSPSQDPVLSHNGGRMVSFANAVNTVLNNVSNVAFEGQSLSRNSDDGTVFYNDFLPAMSGTLTYTIQGQNGQTAVAVTAGGYGSILVKDPPAMAAIRTAAAALSTLEIAPGSLISIFGTGLGGPSDVTVTANGQPMPLLYVSNGQINAYFPSGLSGLVMVQLTNSTGQHSLNVMTTDASPALFSADSSGTGLAAAIHAATGQPVTPDDPAVPGEYIELYGTGFGSTYESGGYQVTTLSPILNVGGVTATVTFCGIPVGGVELYQVNFIVPDGLAQGSAVPLSLSLGSHTSNTVTLPVQ
ncbi:MAG TPA: IPT/TIG domain-containing protein [Bryobacteraceae bacterium]|jgi:uncharacterized protein (TIGR03437 family)